MTHRFPLRAPRTSLTVTLSLIAAMLITAAMLVGGSRAAALGPVETDPPTGAAVGEHPEAIRITFDEPLLLERGANTAVVLDGEGRELPGARVELSGYSARTLLIRPGPGLPEEGSVSVRWTVRDQAGEESSGSFAFAIEPGAEEVEVAPPAGEPRSRESIVLWTVLIGLAIAAVGIGLYFLRLELGLGKSSLEDDSH